MKGDAHPTVNLIMKDTLQLLFRQQVTVVQQSVDDRNNTKTADTIIVYMQ